LEGVGEMEIDNGLSWEEKNWLYGLTCVPALITLFAFGIYGLFYLTPNNRVEAIWDYIYFLLPGFLIGLTLSCLTFEVLHHRKIKQPLNLRVKRFSGRVLFMISAVLSFYGALALSDIFLSPIVGETRWVMVGGIIWMVGFFLVLTTFREFFSRLDRGEW